jgi:hypothetical protein
LSSGKAGCSASDTAAIGFAEKVQRYDGSLISLERMPADTAVYGPTTAAWNIAFNDRGKEQKLPEAKVSTSAASATAMWGSPCQLCAADAWPGDAHGQGGGADFAKGMRSKGFFVMPRTPSR